MTMISKTTGAVSLLSCLFDIHKTAVVYSNRRYMEASSDAFISSSIGAQKTNKLSYKDANRKNFLHKNNFLLGLHELGGRIGGYIEGAAQGVVRYLPNFILSALAIIPKNKGSRAGKIIANLSAAGLAGLEAYDFIKNSTNLDQRTDYLKQ